MELIESRLEELAEWFFNPEAPAPRRITGTKAEVASECFDQLFLHAPEPTLGANAMADFESLFQNQLQQSSANIVDYDLPYPKFDFLHYLLQKGLLLHGTKSSEINELELKEQIDWNGNPLQAVFATRDPFWPLYFALPNRQRLSGSLRNGCFLVEHSSSQVERFYFFSVNQEDLKKNIWSNGFVYILPSDRFHPTTKGNIRFDEWASEQAVPVVAKLPVLPQDFPFLHQVSGHAESESIFTTWLRYKERINVS